MNTTSPDARCPRCAAVLPPNAPQGLCPKCLLMGIASPTASEADPREQGDVPAAPSIEALGGAFPQLEILGLIGRGGMGVVYKARQKSLNRLVALKLLAPERVADSAFARRFEMEARALAALNHPSIVTIYDFGSAGGFYYLLMEFVDGVNLRQAMNSGRFTHAQALAVVPPVCEALQYAHDRGIVHRDIKPENLLLAKDGRVKIADFGIARMLHAAGPDAGLSESQPAGTPQYMAPEQKDPLQTDHRADIYSLGVVLYELLTGETPGARLQAPSRRVQIDVRLDEIVLRALEANPDRRYQTAAEFRTQVQTVVSAPIPPSHPTPPPSPGFATAAPRSVRCHVATPEFMKSLMGKLFMHAGTGRLQLGATGLVLTEARSSTVIPLAAIREVSLGRHSRWMSPVGLDFIRLGFEQAGGLRVLCLTPNEGGFQTVWATNAVVSEWFSAIREAVTSATGRAPADNTSSVPAASGGPTRMLAALAAAIALLVPLTIFLLRPSKAEQAARLASSQAGEAWQSSLAIFSPVVWDGMGAGAFRLSSTLSSPRHVEVFSVELFTGSEWTSIPELSCWAVSLDGPAPFPLSVEWRTGVDGAQPGGIELTLEPRSGERVSSRPPVLDSMKGYSWKASRPGRSYHVGPGEWNLNDTYSIILFEGVSTDGLNSRAVLRLSLSVYALPEAFVASGQGDVVRTGLDWRSGLGIRPEVPFVVTPILPQAPRGEER